MGNVNALGPDQWLKVARGFLRAAPLGRFEIFVGEKLGFVDPSDDLVRETGVAVTVPEPMAGRLRALDADFEALWPRLASGERMADAMLCWGGRCWSVSEEGRELGVVPEAWMVYRVRCALWEKTPLEIAQVPEAVRDRIAVASDRDLLLELLERGHVNVWLVGPRYGKALRLENGRVMEAFPTGEYEESVVPTVDPSEIFALRECPEDRLRALFAGAEGHALHAVHFLPPTE